MKRVGCIFALILCFVSPGLAAPKLRGYAIDINQTSVSGVSSGGAMAVQMHVAYSSIMRGVGVIAGVTYDCANSDLPLASASKLVLPACMDGSIDFANGSIGRTDAAAAHGYIDQTANLAGQNVWLFSGYNDGLVRRGAMDSVAEYYNHYRGNVFYKTNNHAPHALVSNGTTNPCLGVNHDFINNCNYDAAGLLLEHIYGRLNAPSATVSSPVQAFDQREFVDPTLVGRVGLADTGYVYVPEACKTATCRVHIVFHGCLQYAARVNDAVYDKGGYNKWAETNKLIVLYPQTEPIGTLPLGDNPLGCWDWWGLSDALPGNREFARKTGYQISAVKKMLERLKQGPTLGGSPVSTFGKPQHLSATDSSSTYMALIWQPNSAAKFFNIYRSRTKSGAYTKIGTVSGASFGDKNLTPNSTYYYKVSAVDSSNQESAKTGPVHKKTGSKPPGCDPYFGDNITLSVEGRAFTIDTISTWAVTVGVQPHYLGDYSYDVFSQLTKDDNVPWPSYDDRYCP
jgi:poly(3-hydroxybutyrate) depolymerase